MNKSASEIHCWISDRTNGSYVVIICMYMINENKKDYLNEFEIKINNLKICMKFNITIHEFCIHVYMYYIKVSITWVWLFIKITLSLIKVIELKF